MKILQKICLVFTIIGAINWGLIGLFNFNLVYTLFEFSEMLQNAIYIIVGILVFYLWILNIMKIKKTAFQ